jgi:hypothetical protein
MTTVMNLPVPQEVAIGFSRGTVLDGVSKIYKVLDCVDEQRSLT